MKENKIKFAFFGSSQFSTYVIEELEASGYSPSLKIASAKSELPIENLKKMEADVFIVASFGKILPREIINMAKRGSLNVHPSLLPRLRGPAPIQEMIIKDEEPGVTIIKMDEEMDHGPIVAQKEVEIEPWPDHYRVVEEKLGRSGGKLLAEILPKWIAKEIEPIQQAEDKATYMKLVKKEDGLISMNGDAKMNFRKVLAYSTWPGAHIFFRKRDGREIRVVIKDAQLIDEKFVPTKVIPEGKREMLWQDFLKGNT